MNRSRFPLIHDDELVVYALLGNMEAFDELVRRFRVAVILVAEQTVHSRATAEDVAQESFLLAFKALPQLQEPSKFAGWLYAIARHRARRVASFEGRSTPCEPSRIDQLLLSSNRELSVDPEAVFLAGHTRDCLLAGMERLPFTLRIVLYLRCYEEWPLARIAGFLSLSLPTVKWRLHEGRERLRRHIALYKETTDHE